MEVTKIVDAKGLACPMPIVKTKKAMDSLNAGEILEILATDKGALNDLTAWANSGGHELLSHDETDGVFTFHIKKA